MNSARRLCALISALLLVITPALAAAPSWTGSPWAVINDDIPDFSAFADLPAGSIIYQPLDKWLRASRAVACLGPENLGTSRAPMGGLLPSGWQDDAYDFIPGAHLYQRCHLIADQLGGAEILENLVTGTQYLNISAMVPIEDRVAEYIRRTGHHVLYSAWPYYLPGDYICQGVQIEAASVEDAEISINRYCFNLQPGIRIDYRTGFSSLADTSARLDTPVPALDPTPEPRITYVLNTSRRRFHRPDCDSVTQMSPKNRQETTLDRDTLIRMGYKPCGSCNP